VPLLNLGNVGVVSSVDSQYFDELSFTQC